MVFLEGIGDILFIHHLSIDVCVAFTSWLLFIMLLWTWDVRYPSETLLSVLLDTHPEVGLLDHLVVLFFNFLRNCRTFFHSSCTFYDPTNSAQGCQLCTSPPTLVILCFVLFCNSHPNGCEGGISLWFWFAFPWCLVMLNIFSCVCWPFVCLFLENCLF